MSKMDQVRLFDDEHGRDKGLTQFLDEKSYKPGLSAYRRDS
jgi:trans-feruloyl-CoA hydratase/vanillin synthase